MTETQERWLALEITIVADAAEAAEFALSEAGASGTEINLLGVRETPENIVVTGYFNEKPDEDFLRSELAEALRIYGFSSRAVQEINWRAVENKDWLAEWKKHWRPTETGKFIVAPVWFELPETAGKIVIRIEPSMAFGTGTHETTRLCLRAVEENYQPEMSFFDVGTGTGILAVGAAKIQDKMQRAKSRILACDTDFDSIKIAAENAAINETDNIEFYVGSIEKDSPKFDFICANLTADVIVPLLPLLVEKFGKTLLLSGILREQKESVADKLRELGITNYKLQIEGEWISILIENVNNGKLKTEN